MPTIDFAVESYLLDCQVRNLRLATLNTYRIELHKFASFCRDVGAVDLAEVTPTLLRRYFVSLSARQLKPTSIRSAARCLRAWLNWTAAEDLVTQSPYKHIRLPKEDHHTPDSLTPDEVRRLIAACCTQRDRAIMLCLLDSGCRLGEFGALRVGDVDQVTGAVKVRRLTKNRRDRTVFLGQRARAELSAYLAETPGLSPDAPLWRTKAGGLTRRGIQSQLKKIGRRAGVRANPHRFRRTFATWTLHDGMDIYTVAGLMGHSTIDLLKHYLSLSDEDLQRAHQAHGPVDHILK
jgi:site-specific recombinase XerD